MSRGYGIMPPPAPLHYYDKNMLVSEAKLMSLVTQSRNYERPAYQLKALACVPLTDLTLIAQAKYDSGPKGTEDGSMDANPPGVVRDLLLLELMHWFKHDFFKWVDTPLCPHCRRATVDIGHCVSSDEEKRHSAERTERFSCPSCFNDKREVARFPRFNDPSHLLDTRRGRCGEWANCFALIARACGFELRHVTDYTDHVWVEVFSCGLTPNRWMHVDPCENKCDNPLLYESGWGKKLSYVFAASFEDIQDVTWRYSHPNNHKEVLGRRNFSDERELVKSIMNVRRTIQKNLREGRKEILLERLVCELAEFLRSAKDEKPGELCGRTSGSMAWRLSRNEMGARGKMSMPENISPEYQWKITEDKIVDGFFQMEYACAADEYTVWTRTGREKMKGWNTGVFFAENMAYKTEFDWKKVYIARKENANWPVGVIEWRFALSDSLIDSSMTITQAYVLLKADVFRPTAKVKIVVRTNMDNPIVLEETTSYSDGYYKWTGKEEVAGSKQFIVTCELSGGEGTEAWQHSQLFRETTTTTIAYPSFRVLLTFSNQ